MLTPDRVERARRSKGQPRVDKRQQLESSLAQLDRYERRVLEQSRRGLIGEDALDRELSATQRERARLQHDLAALTSLKAEASRLALETLRERLDSSDLSVRRDVLKAVLGASGSIVVSRDGRVAIKSALR